MAGTDLMIDQEREQDKHKLPYIPAPDELRRIQAVKKKYEAREQTKKVYEKTWFVNGSFIRGQHFVSYNDETQNFEVPYRVPRHRVRIPINLELAYYRRTKARLTAHKPALFAGPATTHQDDIERARLDEKVLESEFYRMGFQTKHKDKIGWALECGSGLFYFHWNPWAGEPLFEEKPVTDEFGQPVLDPETGEPQVERIPMTDEHGRQLHEGQNELEVVNPYEIDVDPMATNLDDAEWIMRSKIRSLDWIKTNYPEKGHLVDKEDVQIHSFYEQRLKQIVGIHGSSTSGQGGKNGLLDVDGPSAVVHDYREAKSEKYPKGRHLVTAGNVELYNGENEYKHGLLPYMKTDEITVAGRFWGGAVIEHMIPLQRVVNKAASNQVEDATLAGRPKLLVPKTAKLRQEQFDAEPGEKIEYTVGPRGERPELLTPTSNHLATQTIIENAVRFMQEISSWHEVSRGILPSANIPAEGIQLLQSADETAMGDTASNIDSSLIRLGKMVLSNCNQFWGEERLVRAGGEGARLEAMKVRGEDLVGQDPNADYFDVQVIPGSTMMRDPGKQREQVDYMLKMGILNPIAHRDVIVKLMDVANIESAFEDERQDEQYATRENEQMEQGAFSIPRDFENHDIHIKVLDRFRKSERYRRLPAEIQALYDEHAAIHKQLAVQVGQEKMMIQAMIQQAGMPPEEQPGEGGGEGAPAEQPVSQSEEG